MIQRYSLEMDDSGYCTSAMVEDPTGGFVSFEDYKNEISNGAKPTLCDVLAEINSRIFFSTANDIKWEAAVKEVLSKYFA